MKTQEEIYKKVGHLELKAVCDVDRDFNAELRTLSIMDNENEFVLSESMVESMINDLIIEDLEELASIQAQERANAEPEDWKE